MTASSASPFPVHPARADFVAGLRAGTPQVVWTTLPADLDTPIAAYLKICGRAPMSFLLDSVEGGATRGRYTVLGGRPDVVWRCRGDRAEVNRTALTDPGAFTPDPQPPLESLRALVAESQCPLPPSLPPLAVGVYGFMAYDMVRQVETLPDDNPDPLDLPDSLYLRPTITVVFDNIKHMATVVTPVWPDPALTPEAAYEAARDRLAAVLADLDKPVAHHPRAAAGPVSAPTSNMTRDAFHAMIRKGKEYIAAGDVFQVVLSQRFTLPFAPWAFDLYRTLRRLNPSPFMFYLDLDGFQLVGASPEILVRLRGDTVTIRPIAGTRPRGATPAEDQALAEDLLADPKECAEHLMLLDLGRNDVGRAATIGSVRVTAQMMVEYYSHVMHIVSNVEGTLRPGCDAMDALMAGLPAGTVSGAPKVRAMEIIDELEPVRRGFYAGCVGYFAGNGDMDTCIALRTGLVKDETLTVQAGGGIVYDSDPDAEYQESCNKARALLRAAEETLGGTDR